MLKKYILSNKKYIISSSISQYYFWGKLHGMDYSDVVLRTAGALESLQLEWQTLLSG